MEWNFDCKFFCSPIWKQVYSCYFHFVYHVTIGLDHLNIRSIYYEHTTASDLGVQYLYFIRDYRIYPTHSHILFPYHTYPKLWTSPSHYLLICIKMLDEWQTVWILIRRRWTRRLIRTTMFCSDIAFQILRLITVISFITPFSTVNPFTIMGILILWRFLQIEASLNVDRGYEQRHRQGTLVVAHCLGPIFMLGIANAENSD